MEGLNLRLVFLAAFVAGIGLFLWWDREKVSRHYILFYRRTKRGIEIIDRIAKSAPRFWNAYGWLAAVSGLLSILVSAYFFADMVGQMLVTKSVQNGPSLILPGVSAEPQFEPGVSQIPAEMWVFGIAVLMFVHEMSHGIVARAEDFELNSVGWVVLGVIPGAFVEPKGENMLPGDESNVEVSTGIWEQGSWTSQLKVLGAGSLANYLTGGLLILLAFGLNTAVTEPSQLYYQAQPDYPAAEAGMTNGTLVQINGIKIDSIEDLRKATNNTDPGEDVSLWTSEGNFTLTTVEKEDFDGGYIGIEIGRTNTLKKGFRGYKGGLEWLYSLLFIGGMLNILIGLFNMLPIKPLDGGLMLQTVIDRYAPERENAVNLLSLAGWLLLLATLAIAIGARFLL